MTKTITILAISTILVSVTFIPLAEGVSWPGIQEIGFGAPPVYEASQTFVQPAVEIPPVPGDFPSFPISIRCLDGDWMYLGTRIDDSVETSSNPPGFPTSLSNVVLVEAEVGISRLIGIDALGQGSRQLFDNEHTVTILCLNPSPISGMGDVGGILIQPDSTALFLAYGIANAVWLVPTLAGIGAGIYLTKSKWKKN